MALLIRVGASTSSEFGMNSTTSTSTGKSGWLIRFCPRSIFSGIATTLSFAGSDESMIASSTLRSLDEIRRLSLVDRHAAFDFELAAGELAQEQEHYPRVDHQDAGAAQEILNRTKWAASRLTISMPPMIHRRVGNPPLTVNAESTPRNTWPNRNEQLKRHPPPTNRSTC